MKHGRDREQTANLQTALLCELALRGQRTDPDANRSAGLHSVPVDVDDSRHQGLVELARRRSDLFSASSRSRRGRECRSASRGWFGAEVVRVEGHPACHHCPQDAGVLVGQRDHRLLLAGR